MTLDLKSKLWVSFRLCYVFACWLEQKEKEGEVGKNKRNKEHDEEKRGQARRKESGRWKEDE